MKVIIENMFFGWHENAPETFIKLINSLVVAKDETAEWEIIDEASGYRMVS